jgi:hypothetical protein
VTEPANPDSVILRQLASGQECKVSLTFSPTVLGLQAGTLSFTDNAGNSPQTVASSGTGIERARLIPASVNYGKQAVGTTSAAKTFTGARSNAERRVEPNAQPALP